MAEDIWVEDAIIGSPVHHQLCQAIAICLMLPVKCDLLAWHVLACQVLENHLLSTRPLTVYSTYDELLSEALCCSGSDCQAFGNYI